MSRYRTKIGVWLLAFSILCIIAATLAMNSILNVFKNKIAEDMGKNLKHRILIGEISYIFPNGILLKNVVLAQRSSSPLSLTSSMFRGF